MLAANLGSTRAHPTAKKQSQFPRSPVEACSHTLRLSIAVLANLEYQFSSKSASLRCEPSLCSGHEKSRPIVAQLLRKKISKIAVQ